MENPHGTVPKWPKCNVILSVEHIFIECQEYDRQRSSSFGRKSFKEILAESNTFLISPIFNFLKNCNLIKNI